MFLDSKGVIGGTCVVIRGSHTRSEYELELSGTLVLYHPSGVPLKGVDTAANLTSVFVLKAHTLMK